MDRILQGLKPEKVFYYFEEMSRIPRGSGNERGISDYLYKLAVSKGWETVQDEWMNVIIKKPASVKYEDAPTVMLQGHMDMVCEKNAGVDHDFEKDGIKLRVLDGNVYATDTTLGADNGIAVSMMLAVLDDDSIDHPALEVLITSDEERGMTGVENVDGSQFKSKYLINLDSEEEGVFTAGCAGGCNATLRVPLEYQDVKLPTWELTVKGLKGGHSGMDINKEKGNANKILGRILYDMVNLTELVSIDGGSKTNAIPREAKACIGLVDEKAVKDKVSEWNEILKREYAFTDEGIEVELSPAKEERAPLKRGVYEKVLTAINLTPSQVLSQSTAIDLVICSNNLGVITTDSQYVSLYSSPRSSVDTLLVKGFVPSMNQLAEALGAVFEADGFYPGWEYAKESAIRDICTSVYREMYGRDAKVEAIHAGLECGMLMGKVKGLDAISMGPDMFDVHSPKEHVSIKSVENTYELLINILKKIK